MSDPKAKLKAAAAQFLFRSAGGAPPPPRLAGKLVGPVAQLAEFLVSGGANDGSAIPRPEFAVARADFAAALAESRGEKPDEPEHTSVPSEDMQRAVSAAVAKALKEHGIGDDE